MLRIWWSSLPSTTRTATGAALFAPATSEGVVWAMADRWAPEPTRGCPRRTSHQFPGGYKGLAGRFAVSSLNSLGVWWTHPEEVTNDPYAVPLTARVTSND